MTAGIASAVILLLMFSAALGWVETFTAIIVIAAGSGAYLMASTAPAPDPQTRRKPSSIGDDADPTPVAELLSALPMPSLTVGDDGRIDGANAAARNMFHLARGQRSLASAALRNPALLTALDQALAGAEGARAEYARPGASDEVWMAHISPLPAPERGAIIILEDKSEARRSEQARADFLANASHELRTPLTSLAGFIETMRGPARDDKDSWDRFLEIMFEQTERMRRLIADLLALSRIEFSEHRPPQGVHDLVPIVTRATQALIPLAAERDIALTFEPANGAADTLADPDEVTQAVQNLITNAVKYSPEGGHVRVEMGRAENLDAAKAFAGQQWKDCARMTLLEAPRNERAGAVYLRVTDEGEGIPRAHLPRLGQRFYRVDDSRGREIGGTGLGLAIVKHIMTRHRGGLIVESQPGQGAAFGVWLPTAAKPPGLTRDQGPGDLAPTEGENP